MLILIGLRLVDSAIIIDFSFIIVCKFFYTMTKPKIPKRVCIMSELAYNNTVALKLGMGNRDQISSTTDDYKQKYNM